MIPVVSFSLMFIVQRTKNHLFNLRLHFHFKCSVNCEGSRKVPLHCGLYYYYFFFGGDGGMGGLSKKEYAEMGLIFLIHPFFPINYTAKPQTRFFSWYIFVQGFVHTAHKYDLFFKSDCQSCYFAIDEI